MLNDDSHVTFDRVRVRNPSGQLDAPDQTGIVEPDLPRPPSTKRYVDRPDRLAILEIEREAHPSVLVWVTEPMSSLAVPG